MIRPARVVHIIILVMLFLSAACGVQPDKTPTPVAGPPVNVVEDSVDGYVVLAPRVLRSGQQEAVSVSLLKGNSPAKSTVRVALMREGKTLAESSGLVQGNGSVPLSVPRLAEGDYQIVVSGRNFKDQAPVSVQDGTLVFVETDKPIYKPGQTVHIRVLTLDAELKPQAGDVTIEVQDAKGIK
ncbi:MAG: MG2 domain-containing protein, partial [Chloroflexi bacterium]|nr:MG2 domain-containing protein [Chloroflexota bacterium]